MGQINSSYNTCIGGRNANCLDMCVKSRAHLWAAGLLSAPTEHEEVTSISAATVPPHVPLLAVTNDN